MKVLLDIRDNMAEHLLEVLKSLPYVKTKQLTDSEAIQVQEANAELKAELKEAIEEVNLAKQGKIKLQSARDFLNEL